MAAGIGEVFRPFLEFGFCFPSFLSVLKLTPKSVSKIETIFGFRFLFAGLFPWHPVRCTRRPIFLLRRYIQFLPAHTSKKNWFGLPPANWTTDRLPYVCFWDARRTQGGYWNWSAILETFCEADCGVGIRCNGCGPMNASVAGIYCFGSLFWEALGT